MQEDAIIAIQDMGAAGLTSSSLEMAGKGECGIELNLDQVPMREVGMTPYEIMLSESQERMLMILKPEKQDLARKIFEKWELDFAVIGTITNTGNIVLTWHGEVVADMPIAPVSTDAPVYDRPYEIRVQSAEFKVQTKEKIAQHRTLDSALLTLISSPDLASKRWIYEQYDHMVGNDTVARPGGDAAVVRVQGTQKALAISTDCTPRYCYADPTLGGKQAVAETWRNITSVGALPLAITNCLNFGNPQKPEIMGQIVGCLDGMAQACIALDYPIISGNVSLYNETNGVGVQPTPAIGGVGILKDVSKCIGNAFSKAGQFIFVVGETRGHLGASIYLREIIGSEEGAPPPVDLATERKHGDFVRAHIQSGAITACHDISDGGLLVALAEMTYRHGIGCHLERSEAKSKDLRSLDYDRDDIAFWFGEDQARYVVCVPDADAFAASAKATGIPLTQIGTTGGDALAILGQFSLPVSELKAANEAWLPAYMAS